MIVGSVLPYLEDLDWLNLLNHQEIIFARSLPSQKLEIVKRAQSLGHIVAVTGDGVNDSSALKKADLGIAMNRTGSDVSKESAGMILLDDNFSSTVKGIRQGRLIFINLKKAIKYSLTHIIPEVLPYLLYVVVPLPLAITPTQMLMIDLGFEIFLTLSFAWEPAEDEETLMSVPPRKIVTVESTNMVYRNEQRKASIKASRMDLSLVQPNLVRCNDSTMLLSGDEFDDEDLHGLGRRLYRRYRKYAHEIRIFFTDRQYWEAQRNEWNAIVAHPSGERLVDGEVMCWAYIEAGSIEFIGALVTYLAIAWFEFGMTANDARTGQLHGNLNWKPHSPDLPLDNGSFLVQFCLF